jgi:hypothetical protein
MDLFCISDEERNWFEFGLEELGMQSFARSDPSEPDRIEASSYPRFFMSVDNSVGGEVDVESDVFEVLTFILCR